MSEGERQVQVSSKRSREENVEDNMEAKKRLSNGMVEEEEEEEEVVISKAADRERVVILDAGAQYVKVIDRRVRELKVESVIMPLDTPATYIKKEKFKAIIISGGPNSVNDADAPAYDPAIFSLGLPILGICYGLHIMTVHYGGSVEQKEVREDGQFSVAFDLRSRIYEGLGEEQEVLLTHGDSVSKVPECFWVTAESGGLVASMEHRDKDVYGVQYHPEVDLTRSGRSIMKNFLIRVSECKGLFTLNDREGDCLRFIRETVGGSKVLSLVSGGVDSAVCTALLNAALGAENVVALHIDNGFMRKDESKMVKESLAKLGLQLHVVNAAQQFYSAQTLVTCEGVDGVLQQRMTAPLHSVVDPEEKRRIIGDTFIKVADQAMRDLNLDPDSVILAQGTLRPDLIESASAMASGRAQVIKTHHNDTELVRELRKRGRVIEPLCDFHKDEVRELGAILGLPPSVVYRHPFPGPGLAIRVICQTEPYIRDDFSTTNSLLATIAAFSHSVQQPSALVHSVLQQCSASEQELLMQFTSDNQLSATLLPIYSVGVQGDCRTYNYVAALSSDGNPRWRQLMKFAKIIPRICHNVNRVVWVFGSAVAGPVEEITPTHLTTGVLATLRQADDIAYMVLRRKWATESVSQMPVVLIPIHFDRDPQQRPVVPSCQRSIVIRTFITADFMTGVPATPGSHLPLEVVQEMRQKLQNVPGVSRVLYDLTPKPPGTTEWE